MTKTKVSSIAFLALALISVAAIVCLQYLPNLRKDRFPWKVPEDADQTRRAIAQLTRWSAGADPYKQFGGVTHSSAKDDASGICFSARNELFVIHIPNYPGKGYVPDKDDIRFSVHANVEENIQDPFSPYRVSASIKNNTQLRCAFANFLDHIKSGDEDDRLLWRIITDATGRSDYSNNCK